MKKLYIGLFLSAATLVSSCDLNTTNYGVVDSGNAIQSIEDCRAYVNGIYNYINAKGSGTWLNNQDIQMDQFIGLVDNGNRHGLMSAGTFTVSDDDVTTLFYNAYILIRSGNYIIPNVQRLLEDPEASQGNEYELKYCEAVGHFARAYGYWYLFDKWVDYDASKLDEVGLGLPIEEDPVASGNRATYKERSSIRATVDYINNELTQAYNLMKEYEDNVSDANCAPNAIYLSSYAIAALQARFALLSEDYNTALAKAEWVINSGKYELTGIDDYPSMWVNDEGSELIYCGFASNTEGGVDVGTAYYTNAKKETSDYIPTAEVLLSYAGGDVRMESFFELYEMMISGGEYYGYAFTKFPGNPALNRNAGVNSCLQKAKLFRLSELYLIAAESACLATPKDEEKANKYLNDLRTQRISGYEEVTSSGTALLNSIREERGKELIGEGFRLSDLRRWGKGFTRTDGYSIFAGTQLEPLSYIQDVIVKSSNNVTYTADDYRFLWPIPLREMQVNPQLQGQQNPRWN